MHIAMIVNPKSGRGKGAKGARLLEAEIKRRGHQCTRLHVDADNEQIRALIARSDRALIIGGDGTVHHMLGSLAQTQTPMYQYATGTANLIAKEFGMAQSPQTVVDHLESDKQPTKINLPTCNGTPFLIMLSIGIDASVIHRFEELRSNKGGYRAYIDPVIREIFSPRPAYYSVETPDTPPTEYAGIFIVSNMKSYGGHFNPSPNADPSDGLLDAVSIPCTSSLAAAFNYAMLRLRLSRSSLTRYSTDSFVIRSAHSPLCVQIDGEKAAQVDGLAGGMLSPDTPLCIKLNTLSIQVLIPDQPNFPRSRPN